MRLFVRVSFLLLAKVIDLILAVCWDASLRMWLLLLLFLLPLSFSLLLLLMLKTSLFLFINACEMLANPRGAS